MVLSVAPLGLIGVVAALLLSGKPLGFVAILGILALLGMITKNAVILIGQIELRKSTRKRRPASRNRREQLPLPTDHADGCIHGTWHDSNRPDGVLGTYGVCDYGRIAGRNDFNVDLLADPLCDLVRLEGVGFGEDRCGFYMRETMTT